MSTPRCPNDTNGNPTHDVLTLKAELHGEDARYCRTCAEWFVVPK